MAGIEVTGLTEFAAKLRAAAGEGLKAELRELVKTMGTELLTNAQNEVMDGHVVTGLLVNSLQQGGADNQWEESNGGLTLDVGTNVEYAVYVNDGHYTTPAGVDKRWVPGHWDGGKFVYEPGARTGMLLKRHWVEGIHFWDHAVAGCEPIFEQLAKNAVNNWISTYFGS